MYHSGTVTHADRCIRTEIVRWCAENARPFSIVNDRGFLKLMKTGRPGYWVPSPSTVARDTKTIFARTRKRIAKMLQVRQQQLFTKTRIVHAYLACPRQEYDGKISFATDAWTSPNHKAFVAITVHFLHEDEPISMLLDIVEVAQVRTAVGLTYNVVTHVS